METPADWNSQKERINELYNVEDRTLAEVQDLMKKEYGFVGTEQQYKKRFKAWGFDKKNIKDADMRVMLRKQHKRKVEDGKESGFLLNEKPVPPHKMSRFVKRKRLDDETIAAEDMPTPSHITCQTPNSTTVSDVSPSNVSVRPKNGNDGNPMIPIPEETKLYWEFESDEELSQENENQTHVGSDKFMENFQGPGVGDGDDEPNPPVSTKEQLLFAARITQFIYCNYRSNIEVVLDSISPNDLDSLPPPPDPSFTLWATTAEFPKFSPSTIEFALFFIFQLKRLNPQIGLLPGYKYMNGLFAVALNLSDYALKGTSKTLHEYPFHVPGFSKCELEQLSKKLSPNLHMSAILALGGEWSAWRGKLKIFQSHLPPVWEGFVELDTPLGVDINDYKHVPFGPQEPLELTNGNSPMDLGLENSILIKGKDDFYLFHLLPTNPEPSLQLRVLPAFSISGSSDQDSKPMVQVSASPFERRSARYHISNSPEWYDRDITHSNPLHLLSPVPISTSSQHGLENLPHYPRPASHHLAMMASTPLLSEPVVWNSELNLFVFGGE